MLEQDKPKYQTLKDYLIDKIKSQKMNHGEQLDSENTLSQQFEISRQTVRQAIGELVNEGYLYRIQGKGTFVNKQSDTNTESKIIGVLTTYLNDYIFPDIIKGIDDVLTSHGYNVVLGYTNNQHSKEKSCLERLMKQNINALIVEPTKSILPNPNIDYYRRLQDKGIPVLFIHGIYRNTDFPYVVEDDEMAGYLAARHLIELGHQKICGIFKMDDVQGHGRFSGYQRAHREAGLPTGDDQVLWYGTNEIEKKFNTDNPEDILNLIIDNTAIICYNDQIAIKVLDILRKQKIRVPDQISVVSFDDSQICHMTTPKLTSVAHPKYELGKKAAESVLTLMNGSERVIRLSMEPILIKRKSTAEVRHDGHKAGI